METYNQMKMRHQNEVNKLPIKYAFGKKQYKEMLDSFGFADKSEEYIAENLTSVFGIGDYALKKDVPHILSVINNNSEELRNALTGENADEDFIFDAIITELNNHEYSYTCEPDEALCALGLTPSIIANSEKLTGIFDRACRYVIKNAD